MPIDWTKEFTERNFCGYCGNRVTYCNGSCFTTGDEKTIFERKVIHLNDEIEKTKKRLQDLEVELNCITYRSNENEEVV